MLDRRKNWDAVHWLRQNSKRPGAAMHVWAFLLAEARPGTGAILLTRGEIAGKVGILPDDLSSIMMELVRYGAISRQQEGREVRYFMNPSFFTTTTGEAVESGKKEAEEWTPPGTRTRLSLILPQHEREVPSWTPEEAGGHEDSRESDFDALRRTTTEIWLHWRNRLFPAKRKEDD